MPALERVTLPADEMLRGPASGAQAGDAPSAASSAGAWFNITVVIGWNFISYPLVASDTSMPGILTDKVPGVVWTRAMWYDPLDITDHWKQYNTGWNSSLNDLKNVDNTMGVWLYVTTVGDGILTIGGSGFSWPGMTSINLRTDWNMIGFPWNNTMTVGEFKMYTGVVTVESVGVSYFYPPIPPYVYGVLPDDYVMHKGQAYWVRATYETSLTRI
jgi:hypothetical protein